MLPTATKCVLQPLSCDGKLNAVLRACLTITYNAIHYAEEHGIRNRKGMGTFYDSLKGNAEIRSCYKLASITRACAAAESRYKSRKRGITISHPKSLRPLACITSGFIITMKGRLFIPLLKRGEYFDVQLNRHVIEVLEGKKVRSVTIIPTALSLCYSEKVEVNPTEKVYGVDRNEKNITFGDVTQVVQVDMRKTVRTRQTTREIISSFRRNDARIRRELARKYWRRANHRSDQILHAATNFIIDTASKNRAALAFEDLTNIRTMYRRAKGQGKDYRFRLNSWPHWKVRRMLEYKARWKGVTTIQLTKSETYGSSSERSRAGRSPAVPRGTMPRTGGCCGVRGATSG